MLKIKKRIIYSPASLIFIYIFALSLSVFFVSSRGESTLIDEIFILAILPIAFIGISKYYLSIGTSSILLIGYFLIALTSSLASLLTRSEIPIKAPFIGIILDIKFIVFLGALLYLSKKHRKSANEIVINICKSLTFISILFSAFFLRDIFSNGTSIAGIPLTANPIYGYIPIGLFSHKLYAALLSSLALISSVVLFLFTRDYRLLWVILLFLIILFFSSSMKELGVLFSLIILIPRALKSKQENISKSGKAILLSIIISTPLLALLFGSAIENLIANRIDTYAFQDNARVALFEKSTQIANDYFPLGSGAGTFSSQPSRTIYFSPLYYEYGMNLYYGANEEQSSFLMDAGWPKFIAEAGWLGGGSYFFAYLISLFTLTLSFLKKPSPVNAFGIMIGILVFSSAIGSAVFTSDFGLMVCALLFFCAYLDRKSKI